MNLQNKNKQGPCPSWFFTFLLLSYAHILWLSYRYFTLALPDAGLDLASLFHLTAWLFYGLLYLLPISIIPWLVPHHGKHAGVVAALVTLIISVVVVALLKADSLIYALYNFHINGFVLNLLFTPGGVASLGSTTSTYTSAVTMLCGLITLQTGFLLVARYGLLFCVTRLRPLRWSLTLGLSLFLIQGTVYGISDIHHYGPVLDGANAYPLFRRVRFRSFARSLGYEVTARNEQAISQGSDALAYPRAAIRYADIKSTPNIIILVAESLRWDQLTPQVMPNTWQFGLHNARFDQHYSSGNGTREGLFGMFYGLYGSYWERFLHARQSPLLMDRIQQLGYQLDLRTSAAFTYPEFDKTLFVDVPASVQHSSDDSLPPWQRDQRNMDALLSFLSLRSPDRPFMSFFFLESTHASYSFPEDHALHDDYSREVDYTRLSKAKLTDNPQLLLNRYSNAAHWVDHELGRLYDGLGQRGLLDSTIVIVTGDHGEEFMENGAWGHNSSFAEQQTHVPFIVHMPGIAPSIVSRLTSHLDVATTLLQELGIQNANADYTLGHNLFDEQRPQYLVMSDWHSIAVMNNTMKYRIPYLGPGGAGWPVTDLKDKPLDPQTADQRLAESQATILEVMQNFSSFLQRE